MNELSDIGLAIFLFAGFFGPFFGYGLYMSARGFINYAAPEVIYKLWPDYEMPTWLETLADKLIALFAMIWGVSALCAYLVFVYELISALQDAIIQFWRSLPWWVIFVIVATLIARTIPRKFERLVSRWSKEGARTLSTK